MAIDLTGKPICITGAGSGIGRATALECARAGMPVVLAARRRDRLDEAAAAIITSGGRAVSIEVDVCDPDACARMVEHCVASFGSIYSVFANAGYGVEKSVADMDDAEVRRMFETNFFGTLNTIRPALPHMKAARAGHILMCSSCLSRMSIPFFSIYSATKAAQAHISRAMNLELEPHGVRVTSIHPIGTKTEFFDIAARLSGGEGHEMVEHAPQAFLHSPERVARAVLRRLRRPAPEVWTSQLVRLGMTFAEAMPRTTDFFLRRMVRERREKDHRRKAIDPQPPGAAPADQSS